MTVFNPLNLADPDLLRQQALVGGRWIDAADGRTLPVSNPSTGAVIGHVPNLGVEETRVAIAAAQAAFAKWRKTTAGERSIILRRLFDLMLANIDDLARIMTAEQGKPLAESQGEIRYAASYIEWFSEEAKRAYGDIIPENRADRRILVRKEPVGVFAAITPWNFPAAMITRKAGAGWAAGCAGVIRPASKTPFSALAIGVLAERAGLPPGVCNVITGAAGPMGGELTRNPIVRKLSFTGSTEVGAALLAQCAPTIKKTSMELGGNAPFIVFDDADPEAAARGALAAKFRNSGQTCVCANRLLVQAGIHDAFVEALNRAVDSLKIGDGLEPGVTIGPLVDQSAFAKVDEYVQDAIARGAKVTRGGAPASNGGLFYQPTVLVDTPVDALCFREEIFGPVAPIFRFETEDEAIRLANDTPFGLAAYLYTRDLSRAFRVSEALEYGMVGVNEGLISTEVAPFGGVKASGLGREGSKYGMDDYMELKYVGIALELSAERQA
jgi:succinate-semialdehyde dehydrogenase/glutarate-semialdehyde dehydrogenase